MPRLMLLTMIAIAGLLPAAAQDPVAKQHSLPPRISLTVDGNQLMPSLDSIILDPNNATPLYIDTKGVTNLTCEIDGIKLTKTASIQIGGQKPEACTKGNLAGPPSVQLKSGTFASASITLDVPPAPAKAPPIGGIFVLFLLGVTALLSIWNSVQSKQWARQLADQDADIEESLAPLNSTVKQVEENWTSFIQANRTTSPPISVAAPSKPLAANPVDRAASAWVRALRGTPPRNMDSLIQQFTEDRQRFGDLDPARLEQSAQNVAKIALNHTDDNEDPERSNRGVQDALVALANASGLVLIDPRPNDPLSDYEHIPIKGIVNGPPASRGRVGKVKRRGLKTLNGKVIQQAEVLVYD